MYIRWFDDTDSGDAVEVGGKNASLGEMIAALKEKNINVPDGFATTARAYWDFLEKNGISGKIRQELEALDNGKPLKQVGEAIRHFFKSSLFPEDIARDIKDAYDQLCERYDAKAVDVAVRSSATAEDLPQASFAGQQETYLNITGENELLDACRKCFASLFTDRAITYRQEHGFDHMKVALSVGIQKMVRSDQAGAGVIFTIDMETGFPDVVVINAAWGLGENVVGGMVIPDRFMVFKPLLDDERYTPIIDRHLGEKEKKMIYDEGGGKGTRNTDTPTGERRRFVLGENEVLTLARWAVDIEKHYQTPMDIEWAKDGRTGELFIVQARPETVHSQKTTQSLKNYALKETGKVLASGLAIGQAIAAGKISRIHHVEEMDDFEEGDILVTGMTDPDWVPIMKKSAGIITDHGGTTSHAAIVSRELGVPAIVGTGDGTHVLHDGQEITLSCAEGDTGYVYEGILDYEESEISFDDIPDTQTDIMINIASPGASFKWWQLPCDGIGLARMEFIINNIIKIHPMALLHFDKVEDRKARREIGVLTRGYARKPEYFVHHLAEGIAKIAAPWYPKPVICRMSDFKTNEYANLIGGSDFEPHEANPMLGFRGASRYYSDRYREGFALECEAVKRVREQIGMKNVIVMIPFCRTLEEADRVLDVMAENGLKRGENGLEVYVMCEIPTNIILAEGFAKRFDGFSIGSNDLTQLTLGVDRDNEELGEIFDERNEGVRESIAQLIPKSHKHGRKVGICGQAPSDHPDFAGFLVEAGIDSISLNPDSVIEVKKIVAEAEKKAKAV